MKPLARNDLVELTWFDEMDSDECISVALFEEGEQFYLEVGDELLSFSAWKKLLPILGQILDNPTHFSEQFPAS